MLMSCFCLVVLGIVVGIRVSGKYTIMTVSYTHLDVYKRQALGGAKRSGAATKLNLRELPKPLEIKEFLDQYVIGQDDAKRFLSCLLYTSRGFAYFYGTAFNGITEEGRYTGDDKSEEP